MARNCRRSRTRVWPSRTPSDDGDAQPRAARGLIISREGRKVDRDAFVARAYGLGGLDETRTLYREWAGTYDDHMVGELGYVAPARVPERLLAHLNDSQAPVLDIGCGTGLTAMPLAERGFTKIDGLDITPEMLARSRARGIYRHLILADLTQPLPFADGVYGGAVSSGTFTHGHVGPEPLPEIARVLRPGGLFACSIHKEIWEAKGFKDAFARLAADRVMAEVEIRPDVLFAGQDPVGIYAVFVRL